MLRIAYVLHWNLGPESGVFKKVMGQCRQWVHQGCDVCIFLLCREAERQKAVDVGAAKLDTVVRAYRGAQDKLLQLSRLVNAIVDWAPDIAYLRYGTYYPPLGKLAARVPTVLEVNSNDVSEYRLGAASRYWYNWVTRGILLHRMTGMVFASHELSQNHGFTRYGKPGIVIGNGLDLSQFRSLPAPTNQSPRLVFMGSAGLSWHGVDKISWLARHVPEWEFHLVGIGPVDVTEVPPPNVILHGFLDRTRYEEIMLKADVAIGTLALHRKGMNEASALKVREYLAYGIPTILSHKDTDFIGEKPSYLLQIPNTEDNVMTHVHQIRQFVYRARGTRVPRDEISHLDTQHKEPERLKFFDAMAGRGSGVRYHNPGSKAHGGPQVL